MVFLTNRMWQWWENKIYLICNEHYCVNLKKNSYHKSGKEEHKTRLKKNIFNNHVFYLHFYTQEKVHNLNYGNITNKWKLFSCNITIWNFVKGEHVKEKYQHCSGGLSQIATNLDIETCVQTNLQFHWSPIRMDQK